ncbi:MAG: hypothetical protein K9K66_15720, partial [Desulfarculaceae bacterium]|nr:hypothetical protein [Desulfarculaceae bacterium]
AVFFTVKESPVGFTTPGWRLYLGCKQIDRGGEALKQVKSAIAQAAGEQAAAGNNAAVIFQVSEVRALVDMG